MIDHERGEAHYRARITSRKVRKAPLSTCASLATSGIPLALRPGGGRWLCTALEMRQCHTTPFFVLC